MKLDAFPMPPTPVREGKDLGRSTGANMRMEAMMPYPNAPCALDHAVYLRNDRKLLRTALRDMLLLQADGNYVELIMVKRRVVLRNSMAEVIKSMPDDVFQMVNRRQAVNIMLIDAISHDEVHIGSLSFTLSPRYRDDLLEKLHIISGR